jgi:hypothetical protein
MTHIVFFCEKHYGGYGDRLLGMASAITIARVLGATFSFSWEPEFMRFCKEQPALKADTHLNLINRSHSDILESQPIKELWKNSTVRISANIPVDRLLWKNPHLGSLAPYEAEAIRSLQAVFPTLGLAAPTDQVYECGIQIRCGDTYCMPHSAAVQYIPEAAWPGFAASLKGYLESRSIKGKVYLTSDTYTIYRYFTELNDDSIEFVFTPRTDNIHFDFHNSRDRAKEIVEDHLRLQGCKRIITGLRSNFGTSAAYCSPVCEEMILYSSDWPSDACVQYTEYNTRTTLILKEYGSHKA